MWFPIHTFPSIECYTPQWTGISVLAICVLVLFSVGIPIANAAILYKLRHKLYDDDDVKKLFGTLYVDYKKEYYYFESVMMTFKLLLLMSLIFFEQGSQFQYAAVLLSTFVQVRLMHLVV